MTRVQEPGWVPLLAQIFRNLPRLADAACAGHEDLFDPTFDNEGQSSVRERHQAAAAICTTCPAIEACREWAGTQRDTGAVLGGLTPRHQTPGRPRKDRAA